MAFNLRPNDALYAGYDMGNLNKVASEIAIFRITYVEYGSVFRIEPETEAGSLNASFLMDPMYYAMSDICTVRHTYRFDRHSAHYTLIIYQRNETTPRAIN